MRLRGLDVVRGVAILLMVVDHSILVFDRAHHLDVVRLTVTRASLPMFCLVAGALLSSTVHWSRWFQLVGFGLVAAVVGAPLGIGEPDIILVFAFVLPVATVVDRARPGVWWAVFACAIIQPVTWPMGGTGYPVGEVLALVMAGSLVGRLRLAEWGEALPAGSLWSAVGRWPLSVYVGHLVLLYVLSI